MEDKQLNKISTELLNYLEKFNDSNLIEDIKESTTNDQIHKEHINPKIRLYNKGSNLNILNNKDYLKFIKKMRQQGLYVHTNLDDFKIQKLDTLNKISNTKDNLPKGSKRVPDLDTIYFSTYRLSKRFGGFVRDQLFKRTYLK